MLVQKFRVYLMRKGERHYECVGDARRTTDAMRGST
jgi:hypothetical protein